MNSQPNTTISTRFAAEIVRLGLTVKETAAACGVTRHAINNIGRGAVPGGAVLQGFALAGADVHYILTGQGRAGDNQISLDKHTAHICWQQLRYTRVLLRRELDLAKAGGSDALAEICASDLQDADHACATLAVLLTGQPESNPAERQQQAQAGEA